MKINKFIYAAILGVVATSGIAASKFESTVSKVNATTFTPVETTITDFSHTKVDTGRQRLIVKLSVADWGETPITKDVTDAKVSEYNYHTSTSVNGTPITHWDGWNQRCIFVAGTSQIPNLYFDISHDNFISGDTIKFAAGTQFPSYEYVVNGVGNNAYTLQKDVSFQFNGSAWSVVVPFEEHAVEVRSVKFSVGSSQNKYCYMKIALSDYDYDGGETEDPNWTEMTKFNIHGIKLNGESIRFDEARKNRYRAANSTVILYVYSEDGTGSEYTSVFIPAGTDFPSKEYRDSQIKSKYVVSKDTTLYPSDAGFVEGTNSKFIKINRVNSTRLRLGVSLTNFDHETFTNDIQTDYYPVSYPIFSHVTIDGNAMERWTGMPDSRAYGFEGTAGWGFDFKFTENTLPETVVVSKGTLIASYSYVEGGSEKYYVFTETVTFKHCDSECADYACINTLDTFANDTLKLGTIPTTETGTGKCVSEGWYATAKAEYNAMLKNDKTFFNEDASFADARARLEAWANANGETLSNGEFISLSNGIHLFNNTDNNVTIIIIVSVISLSIIIGFVCYKKRKEN